MSRLGFRLRTTTFPGRQGPFIPIQRLPIAIVHARIAAAFATLPRFGFGRLLRPRVGGISCLDAHGVAQLRNESGSR